ncbi:DEAD/DEAH box helicase [Tardiphaga sp. 839_C3_N1_4]|uniref:DEAD/DEAH box helicase n=1 Tax=Tardiphaga sp. 839_C3_N1_4 TaxID=3240761 RepID=UPI003F26363B
MRSSQLLATYNGQLRGVIREIDDFGFKAFDLAAPPRRLLGSDSAVPLVESGVDGRRVESVLSPAELLLAGPKEESWLGLTQRTLARMVATFLAAEDPQRRLDARKAATLMHQVSLVQHVLEDANLRRVLIADEVGLGKTIEAGLIIKRLTEERPLLRILYLAPARLVQNVASEFRDKLDLDARIWVAGSASDARLGTDRVIVASIHKAVFGENARRIVEAGPWDVLVVDECHHLSDWGIGGGKPTQSFRLVDQLSQSLPPDGRLILMSGTPHQGSEARFKNLLRLLADEKHDIQSARGRVIFRSKDMVRDWKGRPLFPVRQIRAPTVVQLGSDYNGWYNSVGNLYDASIVPGARGRAGGWAKGQALQWAASSVQAGLGFLVRLAIRRLTWDLASPILQSAIAALRPYRGGAINESLDSLYLRLRKQIGISKEEDPLDDEEEPATDDWIPNSAALEELLKQGVELLRSSAANEKWNAVASIIDQSEGEKIVLFAQPVETIAVVADFLRQRYGENPSVIIGDQSDEERRRQVASFQSDNGPRFLVSSRAGGEGLNMQRARRLIHLDVPWNPMELEQRIGRVHRFGSRKTILVDTVVASGSREMEMYRIARDKLHLIARQLDPEQFETLFSRVMSLVAPKELEGVMTDLGAGPVPASASAEIGELVQNGYKAWQTFDKEYRANADKIQNTGGGEACWADVEAFLTRQTDASPGPQTSLVSFEQENDEIVARSQFIGTLRYNNQLYVCSDSGGLLPDPVNGEIVHQLGLNLPTVAATIRSVFLPDQVCGAGYLNRPSGLERDFGTSRFGILCFLRQTIRFEQARAAEEKLSLHSFLITLEDATELSPSAQASLIRELATAVRVKDPVCGDIEPMMTSFERDLALRLRTPSEADVANRVRHVVWPVGALVVV